MKKRLFYLAAAAASILNFSGCGTAPKASPALSVYSPEPAAEYCMLYRGVNRFKLHPDRQYAVFNNIPIQLPVAPSYGKNRIYQVVPIVMSGIIDPLMTGAIPFRSVRRILLDPGHGAHDSGAVGQISREKHLNLLLAQEIRKTLTRQGFQVVMTRSQDTFLSLPDRVALVKKHKADIFISIHHNSSRNNPQAAGIECFARRFPRPEDTMLAVLLQRELIRYTGSVNRGVKFANFAVLRNNPVPSVLIEAGFISNKSEEKLLADPRRHREAARAVAAAVTAYAELAKGR